MEYRLFNRDTIEELKDGHIIIYGAGRYGKNLYRYLEFHELIENVVCFAVTGKNDEDDDYLGKRIKGIVELREELKEYIILVAMKEEYADEVFAILEDHDVKMIYYVPVEFVRDIQDRIHQEMMKAPLEWNKILFYSYNGLGYRCNCKYIAEEFRRKKYPVKLVWVISDEKIKEEIPKEIKTVLRGSDEYYKELYTSKICIANNNSLLTSERKRTGQYYINVWHGYGPFKKVEGAVLTDKEQQENVKRRYSKYDLFVTASKFYSGIYRSSFLYEGEILESGAPRNDILFKKNTVKNLIFQKYNIPFNKKIVLYAPTFRADKKKSFDEYILGMGQILTALKERFGSEFVLLYRFHHMLYSEAWNSYFYEDGIDVSFYPDVQELLAASDVLITDYSSIMWDFSL